MFFRNRCSRRTFIEWSADHLKLVEVELEPESVPRVIRFTASQRPVLEETAVCLQKAFTKEAFGKKKVSVLLNGSDVYVKPYECPLTDETEIRQAIKWDDTFWSPFRQQEVYADFIRLGNAPDGRSRILAVFVKRYLLDAFLAALEENDVYVEEICYGPLEVLHLLQEDAYTYLNCEKEGVTVLKVQRAALTEYQYMEDSLRAVYQLSDASDEKRPLFIGGEYKDRVLALLQCGDTPVTDMDSYKQLDFAPSLAADYVMPFLSDFLCGAVRRYCR